MEFPNYIRKETAKKYSIDAESGTLKSGSHIVEVRNGIPRFIDSQNYAESFGLQWRKFAKTQLDSHVGHRLTEQRLERALKGALNQLSNKLVLELGCGAGRFTEVLLKYGAYVDSVDLSDAVEANENNCRISDRHRVTQADILDLPLPYKSYDYVVCLGVIQHTPDSFGTIGEITKYCKSGGVVIFDHYKRAIFSGHVLRIGMWMYRKKMLRLQSEERINKVRELLDRWLPIHKGIGNRKLAQKLLYIISPITHYYHRYTYFSDKTHYEWAFLDTHDNLTDAHKTLLKKSEIERYLARKNITDFSCWHGDNGIVCRCKL